MADLSSLLDDVMPEVPGAQRSFVLHHLWRTAEDFCKRTKIDQRWLTDITTTTAPSYTLTAPADCALVEIMRVEFDDEEIFPITQEETAVGMAYSVSPDFVLTLNEPAAGLLSVKAAVMPDAVGSTIKPDLLKQWGTALAAGAKARLMLMPKKAWTDQATGLVYRRDYESAVASAELVAIKGHTRAALTSEMFLINGR
jgi:hypothetical protein